MTRTGARILLLILLLAICIPLGAYIIDKSGSSLGNQTEIDELDEPDDDPIIQEDEAMDTVLSMLPGSDYSDIVDFSQTDEDGGWIYEGVIEGKKASYSFQIDGDNGNLLKWVAVPK